MDGFWNKYVVIFKITSQILLHPFAFGSTIAPTREETKRASRYFGEGVIGAFALYQMLLKNSFGSNEGFASRFSELPFAGEIIAAFMIASVMLTGLITHPIARFFSGRSTPVFGSLACFLYWAGFTVLVLTPLLLLVIVGSSWLFESIGINTSWLSLFLIVGLLILIGVYYIATLCTWIGRVYGLEPWLAGVAILFSYTLSSLLSGLVISTVLTALS